MRLSDYATAALRSLDPETAHRLAVSALKLGLGGGDAAADPPILRTRLAGLDLPNPIGLAAGLDKDGRGLKGLARAGFGFVECGSVTPLPQPGNPRPRLFRLTPDRGVINRMGFNNDGLDAFAARLKRRPPGLAVGGNLGANKDSQDRTADYVTGLRRIHALADYVTINISSPNTPGLRALQGRDELDDLLGRVAEARGPRPVFLKIAPDLSAAEIAEIVEASVAHRIDALIVSNTTLERPAGLVSNHRTEPGGLSGRPMAAIARRALEAAADAGRRRLPLIAAGGIDSGAEAYRRIRLGASALQVYSALVFEGPGLIRRIKRDLAERIAADGFEQVSEAVGAR